METGPVRRWSGDTAAYQRTIKATDTSWAPRYIVTADNERRVRLNPIRHLLDSIPCKKADVDLPKIRKSRNAADGLGAGQPIPSRY